MTLQALVCSALLFLVIGWAIDSSARRSAHSPQLIDGLLSVLRDGELQSEIASSAQSCEIALELIIRRLDASPEMRALGLANALSDQRLVARVEVESGTQCQYPPVLGPEQARLASHFLPIQPVQVRHIPAKYEDLDLAQGWGGSLSIHPSAWPAQSRLQLVFKQDSFWVAQAKLQARIWPWMYPYILLTSVVVSNLITFWLTGRLLRRIKHAAHVAQAWAGGALGERIADRRADEFANLCQAFNRMAQSFQDLLRTHQARADAEVRNLLARELHDTAKQRCFALGMHLTALSRMPGRQVQLIDASLKLAEQLQTDLACVLTRLGRPAMNAVDLEVSLRHSLALILDHQAIHWHLHCAPAALALLEHHPAVGERLLLIANEGAANVLRHSQASHSVFSLTVHGDLFSWTMEDDGIGFDMDHPPTSGMGLDSIRQRAGELPQGACWIWSKPGIGTRIHVHFTAPGPLPA